MSLATSPWVFARCTTNFPAAPSATAGTAFTAGASGVDGTAVALLSALTHDVHFLRIRVGAVNLSGANCNAAGDLLVDPAGGTSWSALINDLACGFTHAVSVAGSFDQVYEFPIYIPAGTSIGWRAKTAHTIDIAGVVLVEAYGEPANPAMWWCGQGVETLGIADSAGTSIASGNTGEWGSWTSVGSPTTRLYKAVQLGINGSDAGALQVFYYFQLGYGSTQLPGMPNLWLVMTTAENGSRISSGLVTCSIPAGTQLQARGMCSGTAEPIFVAAYGIY
jgi:hypothetical protein